MKELRCTLLSDGSSDRALIPILTWLLVNNGVSCAIQNQWADLSRLPRPPRSLPERIRTAVELFPCDLLFVHRDAERDPRGTRVSEIVEARGDLPTPIVCVVPVRMTEAWLLINEAALRRSAGNPNGTIPLSIPAIHTIEDLPDPKQTLRQLLREASELSTRRLRNFHVMDAILCLAGFIEDYGPLHALPAFQALASDLKALLESKGWI